MATTPTLILPPPASNAGSNWQKAWTAYQKDPVGGYAAYYNFLAAGKTSGPLLQQGNYPAPGSPGAPTPQNPGGTVTPPAPAGSLAGFPGGAPNAAPPLMISQLGLPPSQVDQLALQAYRPGVSAGTGALPSTTGTPTPVLPSTTTPAPTPTPGTTPPGASGSGGPAQSGGTGTGYGGQGTAGNAGGAEGNHGGFGSTGGGANTQGNAGGAAGLGIAPPGNGTGGAWPAIDLGPWGSGLLSTAAMLAPGYAGMGLGALQAAMRGYNLVSTNQTRTDQGIPDTDFWQGAGAVMGANNYGGLDGNRTIANPDQLGQRLGQIPGYNAFSTPFSGFGAPAETAQGATYNSGPGGLLGLLFGGTNTRALAPGEVNHLVKQTTDPDISALWDGADGSAAGGSGLGLAKQVYSAPIGPTATGAPMPANVLSAKDQAELDKYNAMNGYDANGKASSGMAGGGATIDNGGIYSGRTSYNSNDSSSPNTNAAGMASNATGSYGQRGIGAGTYAKGGYVGSRVRGHRPAERTVYDPETGWTMTYGGPDDTPGAPGSAEDNTLGSPDGPNPPPRRLNFAKGGYVQYPGLGLANEAPGAPGLPGGTNEGSFSPDRELEMLMEMQSEQAQRTPMGVMAPPARPDQAGAVPPGSAAAARNDPLAREADLQKMLIAQAKAVVKGKPVRQPGAKPAQRRQAPAGPSQSDLLNMAELARHQPQQASLPQGAIPMMAQGGPIPPGNMSAAPSPRLENAMPPTASMPSAQGMTGLQPNPQEEYLYQHHVGNLAGGAAVHNQDGSTSTVFQTVVPGPGGLFYNIPTVWDGKILPPEQAYRRAAQIGLDKFPAYRTPEEADSRYMQMHGQMERDILPSMAGGGQVAGQPDQTMDNRPIMANEGEFVIRNSAAKALGPHLLGLLNDPRGAAMVKARLGLGLARAA